MSILAGWIECTFVRLFIMMSFPLQQSFRNASCHSRRYPRIIKVSSQFNISVYLNIHPLRLEQTIINHLRHRHLSLSFSRSHVDIQQYQVKAEVAMRLAESGASREFGSRKHYKNYTQLEHKQTQRRQKEYFIRDFKPLI